MPGPNFENFRPHWGQPMLIGEKVCAPTPAPLPPYLPLQAEAEYRAALAQVAAMTAVTRQDIAECIQTHFPKLAAAVKARVGNNHTFYVTDADGSVLYLGHTAHPQLLQGLAKSGLNNVLADRTKGLDAHQSSHVGLIGDLVVPRRGIIFETGAGTDWSRIRELHKLASAKGSQLICHDLLPRMTHLAQQAVPDVPYMAIPPLPDLLAKCLKPWRGLPTTITLKDTISSGTPSALMNLFETANLLQADQVVISQSLGFAPNASMFLEGVKPNSREFSMKVVHYLLAYGRSDIMDVLPVVIQQADHTLMDIMLDVVHYHLSKLAREIGLNYHEVFTTEHSTEVGPDNELEFLRHVNFSQTEALWLAGGFNHMTYSPFDVHKKLDPRIGQNRLRVTTQQLHLRFGRTPASPATLGKVDPATELLCPKSQVLSDLIDSTDLIPPEKNLAKTKAILRDPQVIKKLKEAKKVGIAIALDIVAQIYGPNHPLFQSLPETEMRRIRQWYSV